MRTALAVALGIGVAALMAPIELTDLRGTTYTAVFRKKSREENSEAA
jgi:hypothetical protein